MPVAVKICIKCDKKLPLRWFSKDRTASDGLQNKCKLCRKEYYKTHSGAMKQASQKHAVEWSHRARAGEPTAVKHWIRHGLYKLSNNKELVWQLAEKLHKKYRKHPYCPFTGVRLIPGINTHLDHIHPRSLRPDLLLDIKNLRFVSADYNIARRVMTDDQFADFCRLIVESADKR